MLVASAALLGCEPAPLQVEDVLGSYTLETVNSQPLPFSSPTTQPAILSGVFEFQPHNRFAWAIRRAPTAPGGTETVVVTDGAYDVVLERIVLIVGPNQIELEAVIIDGVLIFGPLNGLSYRFRKE
jgi:hypothetical protein